MVEYDDADRPLTYTVIRRTWLSRKPDPAAQVVVAIATAALIAGSLAYWRTAAGPWMSATGEQVFQGKQYWRLWTTLFAHADPGHLAANSLLYVCLGYFLRGYFGTLVFPLTALAFGGVTNYFSLQTYPPEMALIGASGMVSWMGGAWLALYAFLNRQISPVQRGLRAAGVALILFAPSETFDPQISYRTHAIGFVLGVLWGGWHFRRHRDIFRSAEVVETITEESAASPVDETAAPW